MLYLLQLFALSLYGACDERPRRYLPVSIQNAESQTEMFSPSDVTGVRPTISSSPQVFEIWLQLSPAATKRWSQLPEGTHLLCVSPRGTVGHTSVEHNFGFGKGGYCFRLAFNEKPDFEAAIAKLH